MSANEDAFLVSLLNMYGPVVYVGSPRAQQNVSHMRTDTMAHGPLLHPLLQGHQ